jgi:heat shock protein HtpX
VKTNTTLTTVILSAGLVGLALLAGWQILGSWAIAAVLGFLAIVGVSVAQTRPDLALRGARELRYFEAPALFDIVDRIARRAGITNEIPLYYVRHRLINAAAVDLGSRPGIIVTDGLLATLSGRELEGVIAHEIAHIHNRDLSMFRFAQVLRHATSLFTRTGVFLLFFALPILIATGAFGGGGFLLLMIAPFASWLLQLALMRTREFAADTTAAELTGDPRSLANALERIDALQRGMMGAFFPVQTDAGSLLRTHPSTQERVARLREHGGHHNVRYTGRVSFT